MSDFKPEVDDVVSAVIVDLLVLLDILIAAEGKCVSVSTGRDHVIISDYQTISSAQTTSGLII